MSERHEQTAADKAWKRYRGAARISGNSSADFLQGFAVGKAEGKRETYSRFDFFLDQLEAELAAESSPDGQERTDP